MEIKLVASDLDGTIIDKNNNIATQNFDAIKKIHEKGITFVVCTGKSYAVSRNVCEILNADYGIFVNGAQIVNLREKKELARKVLKTNEINYCVKIAKENNLHIHLYTEDAIITEELKYMDLRNYILKDKNASDLKFFIVPNIEEFLLKEKPSVFSLVITSENSIIPIKNQIHENIPVSINLINKRGEYKDSILNKEYEYLYITPSNINKILGLNYLSKLLNIPYENMLTIGDNVNDIEMVKTSGIGIAVADSYDEIKEIANYITKNPVSTGAFAEAINKYI